jgi:CheY-like chemotaxis protein
MGPHPALRATFSPREKDTPAHFFLSWTPLGKGGTIPAIVLTAYGGAEYRVRSLETGFQMHVVRPVDPDQLALAIQNVVK